MKPTINAPLASAYCLAFRNPDAVAEAVESFLRQDWPNKELLILNDEPDQQLVFDHPQVRIINLYGRVMSLAGKYNIAVALCAGNVLFPWDADDIFLPHRMSWSVEHLLGDSLGFEAYKTDCFVFDTEPPTMAKGRVHCNYAFTRRMFTRYGGYRKGICGDADDMRMLWMIDHYMDTLGVKCQRPAAPYYIYRKNDGRVHSSNEHRKGRGMLARVAEATSDFQRGRVEIVPRWERDWIAYAASCAGKPVAISELDPSYGKGDLSVFYKGIINEETK